jgi:hypothetical protein
LEEPIGLAPAIAIESGAILPGLSTKSMMGKVSLMMGKVSLLTASR